MKASVAVLFSLFSCGNYIGTEPFNGSRPRLRDRLSSSGRKIPGCWEFRSGRSNCHRSITIRVSSGEEVRIQHFSSEVERK